MSRDGQPQGRSADAHGVALATATRGKEAAYPELLRNGPLRLVVLGSEVGGRWGTGALALFHGKSYTTQLTPRLHCASSYNKAEVGEH